MLRHVRRLLPLAAHDEGPADRGKQGEVDQGQVDGEAAEKSGRVEAREPRGRGRPLRLEERQGSGLGRKMAGQPRGEAGRAVPVQLQVAGRQVYCRQVRQQEHRQRLPARTAIILRLLGENARPVLAVKNPQHFPGLLRQGRPPRRHPAQPGQVHGFAAHQEARAQGLGRGRRRENPGNRQGRELQRSVPGRDEEVRPSPELPCRAAGRGFRDAPGRNPRPDLGLRRPARGEARSAPHFAVPPPRQALEGPEKREAAGRGCPPFRRRRAKEVEGSAGRLCREVPGHICQRHGPRLHEPQRQLRQRQLFLRLDLSNVVVETRRPSAS